MMGPATTFGMLLMALLAGQGQAQPLPMQTSLSIYTTASAGQILCEWKNPAGDVREVAGGKSRQYYQRGTTFRDLSCPAYYATVDALYQQEAKAKIVDPEKWLYFQPWALWQCWYDDPCSCEQERS
jgi:hypothetical protein